MTVLLTMLYINMLVIKAQITTADDIMEGNSLKFPDENDIELINGSFNGLNAQILVPNELLRQAFDASSKISWS